MTQLVSMVEGDLRDFDLSVATVIVLYLLPESVELISAKLRDAVDKGTILICNTWGPKNMVCNKINLVIVIILIRKLQRK